MMQWTLKVKVGLYAAEIMWPTLQTPSQSHRNCGVTADYSVHNAWMEGDGVEAEAKLYKAE